MTDIQEEAKIFANYLVRREASPQALRLYENAIGKSKPNKTDQKLLNFMYNHPNSIGFIDAGLIITNPESEARRRLYVMLAILEASPEHADLFLPKKRNPFYILTFIYSGIRAVVKAVLGFILVKVVV